MSFTIFFLINEINFIFNKMYFEIYILNLFLYIIALFFNTFLVLWWVFFFLIQRHTVLVSHLSFYEAKACLDIWRQLRKDFIKPYVPICVHGALNIFDNTQQSMCGTWKVDCFIVYCVMLFFLQWMIGANEKLLALPA